MKKSLKAILSSLSSFPRRRESKAEAASLDTGQCRNAKLFFLGLISALAFAPYFQVWLLFVCLPLFIILISSPLACPPKPFGEGWKGERDLQGATRNKSVRDSLSFLTPHCIGLSLCDSPSRGELKSSFFAGWCFGFGHFLAGLYWISISLLVEPEKFAWLIPFAVSLIPAILAIFTGLIAVALRLIKPAPAAVPFLFASLWALSEWLRGHLFTGFPWNLIGYSWNSLEVLQSLSLIGIYGLGFITAMAAVSPVVFILKDEKKSKLKYAAPLLSALILVAAFIYGSERLKENPTTYNEKVGIRIVQPNIPETDRVNPAKRMEAVQKLVQLSTKDLPDKTKIIIWPEAAISFLITGERDVPPEVWEVTKSDRYLVTGADRAVGEDWSDLKIWNSVFVLKENEIAAYYDKTKLVPFGEYIPFRKFLPPFINKITPGAIDFSDGNGARTLAPEGMPPMLPLICYEAIYPEYVAEGVASFLKPKWMVNATNDSWFGNSSGPYQHLAEVRARAVEQGVPVIRSANTGVSGLFDSYGRLIASAELNTEARIDNDLPETSAKPTIYSSFGGVSFWVMLALSVLAAFAVTKMQSSL